MSKNNVIKLCTILFLIVLQIEENCILTSDNQLIIVYLFHFEINFWFIRTSTSIFVWIKINWDCEVSATLYHLTYIFIHLVLVHPRLCNGIQCLVIFCQICIFISTFISSLVILALRIKRKINKSFHRISSTSGHSGTLFSTFRTRFKKQISSTFPVFFF